MSDLKLLSESSYHDFTPIMNPLTEYSDGCFTPIQMLDEMYIVPSNNLNPLNPQFSVPDLLQLRHVVGRPDEPDEVLEGLGVDVRLAAQLAHARVLLDVAQGLRVQEVGAVRGGKKGERTVISQGKGGLRVGKKGFFCSGLVGSGIS